MHMHMQGRSQDLRAGAIIFLRFVNLQVCGIMICIPLVVSWIMIVIEEILCCNFYTCTCIHFFICMPICTINVYDKHSVFSPDGLIHPFIHLPLSSHFSVYILIIILT